MIQARYGKFVLVCDNCEDEGEKEYLSFQEAVEGKKEEGWKSKKYSDGFKDLCNDCKD
jgi:hypothetical protein